MKTAMEELIEYIEEFTPKNKTTSGIWSKAKSLIELEKEQIKKTFNDGSSWELYGSDITHEERADKYFNEMFNK